ncbi:EAL domain-containing protein [Sulfurimonas sp.]|uniref:EAL domain-containing protein n=1 Tax=Sulfurimonas sp. TaxID=2022749 RepID=UPI0035644B61
MRKKINSLSSKIVFLIAVVTLTSILLIFNVFEKINKEAFYSIETQKAKLVLSTIEPLIALNIYLNLNDKIEQVTKQLLANPNILSIKVLQGEMLINERKSKEFENNVDDSFIVEEPIFQPNSEKKIGKLILIYSSKNYKELVDKYTKLLMQVLVLFGVFFLLFGLYIKKLLSPLRRIADLLKNYSPDKNLSIPFKNQNNEIGFISNALNNMQQSIIKYSEQQKNINKYLEEKVDEKTLELRKQLYTNALTGLPNRISLLRDINDYNDGALLIVNIDDFKEINDFFGQAVGDDILIAFSKRLSNMIIKEQNITLIHLSGDEFALFFTKKPSKDKFIQFAVTFIKDIEKMIFYHEDNELTLRVSIGATFQIQEALEKADIALKSARKQGKEFLLYDETLNVEQQYKNNIEWTKKLNWAIEHDRIIPFYQGIYDNKTNELKSSECLIRLIDKENNIITPYHFLTIAKKSKLYAKLTKIMIEKSCKFFEHLDCDFSINLSVEDVLNEEIVEYIIYNMQKYNVSKKIVFEILETEGIENYEEVSSFIDEMKSLGCRIAIDDFGSGYSNFEYLLQLNIDYIKIDGSLIKNLDVDRNAQIVVETIVSFAKKLNIVVIAEYVHSEEVYKKVKELNIERSQGYFLAKPEETITCN